MSEWRGKLWFLRDITEERLLALQCGLLDQEAMKFYAASDYIVRILSVVQSRGTEALVFVDFIWKLLLLLEFGYLTSECTRT